MSAGLSDAQFSTRTTPYVYVTSRKASASSPNLGVPRSRRRASRLGRVEALHGDLCRYTPGKTEPWDELASMVDGHLNTRLMETNWDKVLRPVSGRKAAPRH